MGRVPLSNSEQLPMPEQSCIFCEIVAGRADASVVYENECVVAFLDLFSINEGHTLVVPRKHASQLDDMTADIGVQVFAVAHRLAHWIRESGIECEGLNLLLSDGEAAGQEVPHVHMHVLPRYEGDEFGFRIGSRRSRPTRADLDSTAARIRSVAAH